MIEARDVTVKRGGRIVLDGADLVAREGEVVGIVGPNGSGKSSFMLALYRALELSGGEVLIDRQSVKELGRKQIAATVAVVAQETEASLPLSVHDSIALGRLASKTLRNYGDTSDEDLIDEAMRKVKLTELGERLITELSGGERQRVLIARAMVQQTKYLFLDEPTNHLDLHYQFELLRLIAEMGCTTIVVLHDLNLAARCCDRIVVLNRGRVAAVGSPAEVLTPETISPIYRLQVTTITHNGRPHLVFDPLAS